MSKLTQILITSIIIIIGMLIVSVLSAQPQQLGSTIKRDVKCFQLTDEFQKIVDEQYTIRAAGAVETKDNDTVVMSLVLISKDGYQMVFAEMINSKHICILSSSANPRFSAK